MSQGTPNTSLLAEAFHVADVSVGKLTELFHDLRVLVAVFVGADVYALATEHRFFAFQVFLKQSVHELVSLRVEEVKVVHAILLASDFGHVVSEGQRMCRSIDFWNDFYKATLGQLLQVDEFLLGVMSVAGCESRICIRFEAECSISLVPVVFEELLEAVVVQVDLEAVHLVVGHNLYIVAQVMHRDELASAVYHEATDFVVRKVADNAFRECEVLFGHLQEGAGSPIHAHGFGSREADAVGNADGIAFLAQLLVCL